MIRYFKRVLLCTVLAMAGMGTLQAQNNFVRHTVVSGETLYRLSVKYGVTVEQIVHANPSLKDGVMKAGMQLLIPSSTPVAAAKNAQKPAYQATHKVERKETLWAISQKYGVTPEEIIAANPEAFADDNKLRKGTLLNIPYATKQPVAKEEAKPVKAKEKAAKAKEDVVEEVVVPAVPKTVTTAEKKKVQDYETLRIAVVLPFTDHKSVTPMCVEFYRGLLMAVDSLKATGANIQVSAYNETEDAAAIALIKGKIRVSSPHIIIGPAYVNHLDEMGDFAASMPGVKWVVPFSSKYNMVKYNENAFLINAPDEYKAANTAELIVRAFKTLRVVFFNEPGSDEAVFASELRNSLMAQKVEILDLPSDCTLEQMQAALAPGKRTLFVPSVGKAEGAASVLERMGQLRDATPNAEFSLMGYPDWILESNRGLRPAMFKADTYVMTPHFYNPGNWKTRKFINEYKAQFKKEPIEFSPITSLLGYDLGFYCLTGLKTYGADFNTQKVTAPYLQTQFRFDPTLPGGGYVNGSTYFIHYSTENKVTRITGK